METKQELSHVSIATELFQVQQELEPLQEREKELKQILFGSLKKQHVKSVKMADGTLYTIAERQSLSVVNDEKAEEWFDEHYAWKPDTGKALKILRRELKLPKFFKIKKTEHLRIVRPGQTQEED